MLYPISRRFPASRNGLSFFEFIGCLFALTGGVVLGAMYLGIDVKGIATSVLQQTKLIETPATDAAAVNGETASDEAAGSDQLTLSAADSGETATVETTEDGATPTWQEALNNAVKDHMPPELPIEEQVELTRGYWATVTDALEQADKAEALAASQTPKLQLYELLAQKKQLYADVVESLEPLDSTGVNARAASYTARLKKWNEDGVKLYSRAMDLLTASAQAKLSGPAAQSWQSSATQHRMEGRLLKDRRAALVSYVSHWLETAE